jgi:scyllo-inositol 2-dehydrogenase (NADP+)
MADKIQVGLVGYGLSGEVFHAPFIHTHPHFHLRKVVERHKEKSKERYPYVEVVKRFEEIIHDDNIELVVITTPNELHFPMAKEALLAGKHVVIEKPFTVTADEAEQLIEIAKQQGLILSVYQNRRWDGDFLTVKKVVEERLLGDLVEYEAHFDRFRNNVRKNAWKEEDRPGSGILYDLGSHLIDQALVLFGMPNKIEADLRIQRPSAKTVDYFDIRFDYGHLKVILKASMLVREPGPKYILHGTEGSFVKYGMDPQEEMLRSGMMPTDSDYGIEPKSQWGKLNTYLNGLHYEGNIETVPGNYQNFYQNIYEAIKEGKPLEVTPEQALNTIKIIEQISNSAKK